MLSLTTDGGLLAVTTRLDESVYVADNNSQVTGKG
jgi:hypothetical protein